MDWAGISGWRDASGESEQVLLNHVASQGVVPLLFKSIVDSRTADEYPVSLLKNLKDASHIAGFNEQVRAREVARLFGLLQANSISPILIKGGALAYTHYLSPELRTRQDTDLFIDMGDINEVVTIFVDAGYRIDGTLLKSHQFTAMQVETVGGLRQVFDIHWRISNNAKFARHLDYQACLNEAIEIDVASQTCLALGAMHSLWLSCVHRVGNANHDENRWIWLYDIRLLLDGMSVQELEYFSKFIVSNGDQAVCFEGIGAAAKILGSTVPEALNRVPLASANDGFINPLRHSYLWLFVVDLWQLPSTVLKLGLMKELLVPNASYMTEKHGDSND